MPNELNTSSSLSEPPIYQIRLKGQLGSEWAGWFEGLTVILDEDGDTLLVGPVADQAALHGLLKKEKNEHTHIDYRNRSKSKAFIALDICVTQYGPRGYSLFDGFHLFDPRCDGFFCHLRQLVIEEEIYQER